MNSLAAGTFFENFQIAHTFGSPTFQVPPGPAASGRTYVSLKTLGFVSSVVRNAEIASWTQLATPDARYRLSERSEEHTSELQSQSNLVCRLLLEKKKKNKKELMHLEYTKHD